MSRFFLLPRRVPFTLALLLTLLAIGVLTGNLADRLSPAWYHQLGFAPRDLWTLEWRRLVTSALTTAGGDDFWLPWLAVALVVGVTEWTFGTRWTFIAFWALNLATLALEALLVGLSAHLLSHPLAIAMIPVRDVGPSAGIFGLLGVLSGALPKPWRWISGAGGLLALALILIAPPESDTTAALAAAAGLAHLIAFPLGWTTAALGRHRRRADRNSLPAATEGNAHDRHDLA